MGMWSTLWVGWCWWNVWLRIFGLTGTEVSDSIMWLCHSYMWPSFSTSASLSPVNVNMVMLSQEENSVWRKMLHSCISLKYFEGNKTGNIFWKQLKLIKLIFYLCQPFYAQNLWYCVCGLPVKWYLNWLKGKLSN